MATYFFWKLDDPRWRHNDALVSPQSALFFDVLHHEAGDFVVISCLAPGTTDGYDLLQSETISMKSHV